MKKLLCISYFWPPAIKATSHWLMGILKYLPALGWNPSLLTVQNNFSNSNITIPNDLIAPEINTIKTFAFEPFSIYRKFTGKNFQAPLYDCEMISEISSGWKESFSKWIRGNIYLPDARIGWFPFALRAGLKYLKNNSVDAIVTIGPPHSTHLIGRTLSKKYGIPFVPVFIDPWTDIIYYKEFHRTRISISTDKMFEKKVIEHASKIIFVSETNKLDYISKYPDIIDKSFCLYWGYSEEYFQKENLFNKSSKDITILHTGNLFDYQNPENLWPTLHEYLTIGKKVKLKFTGTVGPLIKSEIKKHNLENTTEYLGIIPYQEMIRQLFNADVLLLCPAEKRHVPGKLFEYLRSGNPILAFGDDNPEVKSIIENSGAGLMVEKNSDGKIFFNKLKTFSTEKIKTDLYERKIIAENFVRILDM